MAGWRKPALPASDPAFWLATWFGVGLAPRAAGTAGSLAALPFAWLLVVAGGPLLLGLAAALAFAIGCWAAGRYARADGNGDPSAVVIDEVAGQWLALLPAGLSPWAWLAGFALFRVFDIAKPWPIGWVDKTVKGGFGIMADDLLAGLAAAAGVCLLRLALGEF